MDSRTTHRGFTRRAFTIIDVMIVVVVLGILATVTVPILAGHLETAQNSAAQATFSMTRKALDMYFQQHMTWPPAIDSTLFVPPEPVTLPRGWQMEYWPSSGELDLNTVVEATEDELPPIVVN